MTVQPARVVSFFTNLIDEQIELLGNHLTDDVILYWYGRTVKGKELVLSFLCDEIVNAEHNLTSVQEIPEIQYRNISVMSSPYTKKIKDGGSAEIPAASVGLVTAGFETLPVPHYQDPCQNPIESSFQPFDGSVIQNTPDTKMPDYQRRALLHKPKKSKISNQPSMSLLSSGHRSFLEARGSISFQRVGRYGYKRSWHRECTLQLAYSCPIFSEDPVSCCEFSVIIYSDNMKCRRNLARVFEHMKIVEGNLED